MSAGMESRILVDGIVVIGKSWSFLEPKKNAYIELPIRIKPISLAKCFKGNRILRLYSNAWTIKLFSVCDVDVNLLLCSSLNAIPFTEVINLVKQCLVNTVLELPSSPTSRIHDQTASINGRSFPVILSEFVEFGIKFSRKLNTVLSVLFTDEFSDTTGNIDYFFTAHSFGQCCELNVMKPRLQFNWNHVLECIFHFANDYVLDGFALLWKRKAIVEVFDAEPNYEYCPIGLCGVGNYYYMAQRFPTNPSITVIKFYGEFAKYCNNNKDYFKSAEIADVLNSYAGVNHIQLSSSKLRSHNSRVGKFNTQCKVLLKMVDKLRNYTNLSARCELMVSVEGGVDLLDTAISCVEAFIFESQIRRKLLSVPITNIIERVEYYLISACLTIEKHLKSLSSCLSTTSLEAFTFTVEDYLSVAAAEIVISFVLFGSVVSTRGKRCHDNRLVRDLGLTVRKFREIGELNPELGNGKLIIVNNSIVYRTNMVSLETLRLPSLFPRFNLHSFLNALKYFQLGSGIVAVQMVFDVIVHSALIVFKKGKVIAGDFTRTCRFQNFYYTKQVVHVQHFINIISHYQQMSGLYLLKNVRYALETCLTTESLKFFYCMLSEHIRRAMIDRKSPMLFPLPFEKKMLIVIPTYLVVDIEVGIHIFTEAFFFRYCFFSSSLRKMLFDLLEMFKYVSHEFWDDFKKMNFVFCKLLVAVKHKQTVSSQDMMEWFN